MNAIYKTIVIIGLLLTTIQLVAQEDSSKVVDPLSQFKRFSEIGISIGGTRINTEHATFTTSEDETFNFKKNRYLPTVDAAFNFGWLVKNKENHLLYDIRTGLNIATRNADLMDEYGNDLRLSTQYLQIPIEIGYRYPLNYNPMKNGFYRAVEIHFGLYAATPYYQKLDAPKNIDAEGKAFGFNYFKFGVMGEIAFTSLNNEGYGHKFGLKFLTDFTTIAKLKNTKNELYPYYFSVGLFYNIANDYYR